MDTILFFENFQQVVDRRVERMLKKGIDMNGSLLADLISEIEAKTAVQFFSVLFSPAKKRLIRSKGQVTAEIWSILGILQTRWIQFQECSTVGHVLRTATFKQMIEENLPRNVHPEVFWDSLRERKRQKLSISA